MHAYVLRTFTFNIHWYQSYHVREKPRTIIMESTDFLDISTEYFYSCYSSRFHKRKTPDFQSLTILLYLVDELAVLSLHSHSLDRNLWPWELGQVFRPQEVVSNLSRPGKRSSVVNTVTQNFESFLFRERFKKQWNRPFSSRRFVVPFQTMWWYSWEFLFSNFQIVACIWINYF